MNGSTMQTSKYMTRPFFFCFVVVVVVVSEARYMNGDSEC